MTEPTYPPTPHRRRTPCCDIEAFRYLDSNGFVDASAIAVVRGRLDAMERAERDLVPDNWGFFSAVDGVREILRTLEG